ncbi:hypothetical protein, partial [Ruegeria arenilitoris]|uniref:hypothetical protein n=1 Tax=Ruegeria arenilitoris TaxID=1173585 RepID=UPI001C2BCAC3
VARQAHNLKVAGSNPAPATKSTKSKHQTSRPRAALLVLNRSFSTNPTIADKTKGKIGGGGINAQSKFPRRRLRSTNQPLTQVSDRSD